MSDYFSAILSEINSGVITTNGSDKVAYLNRAAEQMLAVNAEHVLGQHYSEALPGLGTLIAPLIETVRHGGRPALEKQVELDLPGKGHAVMRLRIKPLMGESHSPPGIAIIIDDLTEYYRLQQQARQTRETLERYLPPQVVSQLLAHPENVQLGGVRQEVTILFADIRNFVSFGERVEPEFQVEVLNRHLTVAAEAVLAEDGTIDKFMGDCMMSIFNAPLPQPDHPLRAVRAALRIQRAVAELHTRVPPEERLHFGIGITTGHAVVGNIGSTTHHTYTAIGDIVNLAYVLQAHARPGQVLIGVTTYERVKEHVCVRELGPIQLKGHSQPDLVFEVTSLRDGS
ncbi:MAG: PAS domain-containing protein [Anaerolineae bacterium]|nr:PAS domain-containing protein [Anaerolineae bacterium]